MRIWIALFLIFVVNCVALSQSFDASGWCQGDNNVNCSNWPTELSDIKRSVFLYSTGQSSCTGTLINQKVNQGQLKQYFITAKHCIKDANLNIPWSFRFNYQSPDCNDMNVPDISNINGSNRTGSRYLLTSPVSLIEDIGLTDFAILEIINPIPVHYNVYYAGWSVSFGQALQLPNYDIHHPRSDIKKVAKTFSTMTVTNYACHTVTEVVDVVLNFLFGWAIKKEIRTRTVCAYVEAPIYGVPFWSNGVVEPGSSGSSLLNNDGKIIGTLSGGLSNCDFPLFESFGRLNTSYNKSSSFRNAVNPSGNFIFSLSGRQIDAYPSLENLSGQYFPAKDYQSNNQIKLKATGVITTSASTALTIRSGADFVFESGQGITLRPGFTAQAGSTFTAKVSAVNARVAAREEKDDNTELIQTLRQINLPENKRFEVEKYIPEFKGTIDEKTYFSVSPNPVTSGQLNVDLIFSGTQRDMTILILDQQGREVFVEHRKSFQSGLLKIDISGFTSSLYILKIVADNEVFTEKILKK